MIIFQLEFFVEKMPFFYEKPEWGEGGSGGVLWLNGDFVSGQNMKKYDGYTRETHHFRGPELHLPTPITRLCPGECGG
jgi:hypothetical protein